MRRLLEIVTARNHITSTDAKDAYSTVLIALAFTVFFLYAVAFVHLF